jgi:hypothetical protein
MLKYACSLKINVEIHKYYTKKDNLIYGRIAISNERTKTRGGVSEK